jgi:CheY-like chemotaxis protein
MKEAIQNRSIRVVLCDDVAEMRRILREVLEEDPAVEVVDEAGTGRECLRVVTERRPDVLILDLSMPDMDGLEALPLIAEASPGTRIVVFSGFAADRMRAPALDLGADLYFEKGTALDSLADAVRDLARDPGAGATGGSSGDGGGLARRSRRWMAAGRLHWLTRVGLRHRHLGDDAGAAVRIARNGELPVQCRDPLGQAE